MSESWQCPYCNRHTTVGYSDKSVSFHHIKPPIEGKHYITVMRSILCPNMECEGINLLFELLESNKVHHHDGIKVLNLAEIFFPGDIHRYGIADYFHTYERWNLLPESAAKPFPDYIPEPIRKNYKEACLIKDKSPTASATLARRCLQGMVRNFWKIERKSLKKEIDAIKDEVDPQTWEAIEAVRTVGNIAAHMEKDINLIIDIDSDEAGHLIYLIEFLMENWYINRHNKQEKLKQLRAMAEQKKGQRTQKEGEETNDAIS